MNRDLQGRKCSHCGHNGHYSRTCHGKGFFKLFGVKINLGGDEREYQDESTSSMAMMRKRRNYEEDECMRKSKSMDNLVQACNFEHDHAAAAGYLSDGVIHTKSDRASASHERKKTPPRTSPASPFDKAAEVSQQVSTTLVDPLKNNINEIQGQASSTSIHVEKPPLSPMASAQAPNICHMPYMVGVPGQRITAATVMRRELFPMMTCPNPCAPFMNQKYSSCLYFGPFPNQTSRSPVT